jgi:hypothetical protein
MSEAIHSSDELYGLKLGEKNAPPPPGPRLTNAVGAASIARRSNDSIETFPRRDRLIRRTAMTHLSPRSIQPTRGGTCGHGRR